MLGSVVFNNCLFSIDKKPEITDYEVSDQFSLRGKDGLIDHHLPLNRHLGEEFLKIQECLALVLAFDGSSTSHIVMLFYKRG